MQKHVFIFFFFILYMNILCGIAPCSIRNDIFIGGDISITDNFEIICVTLNNLSIANHPFLSSITVEGLMKK